MSQTPPEHDRLFAYRLEKLEETVTGFGERFDKKLDGMIGRFVSTELYNADKTAASDRHLRAEARIRDLEQEASEREKQARAARLSVALASVAGVLSAAGIIAGFLR